MAALLKSAESKDFVGSNPTLSAITCTEPPAPCSQGCAARAATLASSRPGAAPRSASASVQAGFRYPGTQPPSSVRGGPPHTQNHDGRPFLSPFAPPPPVPPPGSSPPPFPLTLHAGSTTYSADITKSGL